MNQETMVHLTNNERKALIEYETRLRRRYNGLIDSVILFGSKARGDARADSDVDVLVIVNSEDWRLRAARKQGHRQAFSSTRPATRRPPLSY